MLDTSVGGPRNNDLIAHASRIVAAYVGNNSISSKDLPELIRLVHDSLATLDGADGSVRPEPAVSVTNSISEQYLVCLEDGKKFKSLKRHLRTAYDMTPEEYREKWGLPTDYPMVAPAYSRQRSKLAKKTGLGRTDK